MCNLKVVKKTQSALKKKPETRAKGRVKHENTDKNKDIPALPAASAHRTHTHSHTSQTSTFLHQLPVFQCSHTHTRASSQRPSQGLCFKRESSVATDSMNRRTSSSKGAEDEVEEEDVEEGAPWAWEMESAI